MRRLKWILAGGGLTAAVAASITWLVLLSPYGYAPPPGLPPVTPGEHAVFVYGTLRHAWVRRAVIGRAGAPRAATLDGFRRQGRLDLAPETGASVDGAVLVVQPHELRRLDRYERLGLRYERIAVTLRDGRDAWVYLRLGDD